jgi:hypothetical protein
LSYVYRFLNQEDEIIYVGKTENLKIRIKQHLDEGHLPKECYDEVRKIEFIKLYNQYESTIYEVYYINTYQPKYNIEYKYEEGCVTIELPKKEWNIYKIKINGWYEFKDTNIELKEKLMEESNRVERYLNKAVEDFYKRVINSIDDLSDSHRKKLTAYYSNCKTSIGRGMGDLKIMIRNDISNTNCA